MQIVNLMRSAWPNVNSICIWYERIGSVRIGWSMGWRKMMPAAHRGQKNAALPLSKQRRPKHYTRSPGSSRASNVTLARRSTALKTKELPL
jgi:hypothetical protein